MKTFCKGAIFGMIAGASLMSVAIVKDKNFYNMVKSNRKKSYRAYPTDEGASGDSELAFRVFSP